MAICGFERTSEWHSNAQVECFSNSVCGTTWLPSVGNSYNYITGPLKKIFIAKDTREGEVNAYTRILLKQHFDWGLCC